MGQYNGILFNWSSALGAWALGGPLWAVTTFFAVALMRVSLDAQALRIDNAELRRRILLSLDDGSDDEYDAPPESETRLRAGAVEPGLASQG